MSRFRFVVMTLLFSSGAAFPWGSDGHRVVAKIAAKNLTSETRHKIAVILQTNDAGVDAAMANAATWPDEINKKATGTENWHFIDVPVGAPFSTIGLCPQHNCVIDRIQEMSDRLQSNATGFALAKPPKPQFQAAHEEMNFLIHFVGDIHQPLHAGTNGDRGGNCVALTQAIPHANGRPTKELHAVWDVDEVLAVFQAHAGSKGAGTTDEDDAAAILFARYKSAGSQAWEEEPVEDWARESNDLARADVYQKLKIPNRTAPPDECSPGITPVAVDSVYLASNVADVEQQLMRAGIRLSDILNRVCAAQGCAPVNAQLTVSPPSVLASSFASPLTSQASAPPAQASSRSPRATRPGHQGNAGEFMSPDVTKSASCMVDGVYPDSQCTPGAVMGISTEIVCTTSTRGRRAVTTEMKRQVYAQYGITYPAPSGAFEVDHFIPLELGGSNDIANLWPEASQPKPGFHEKDHVETALHDEVCKSHTMTLEQAQRAIATDWLKYYNEKVKK